MANIIGKTGTILKVDAAPDAGAGTPSPLNTFAQFGSSLYLKTDAADTDWSQVGGGLNLSATAVLDFATVNANAFSDLTITVPGAALGDTVCLGLPNVAFIDMGFTFWVIAADTVNIRARNPTGGNITIPPATFRATIIKFP